MHRSKVFILIAALCLCAVLTAFALNDGALAKLWDSGCDFLFRTDNVTVTGKATFFLDGERFKTAELNYIQDGYSSYYGLKLLTPKEDGEQETGWIIISDEDGYCSVMEAYTPGVYRWATSAPQNTLLRRTVRLDALTELGGLLMGQVEPLLPEGTVTVAEAEGTKTIHIALADGQTPDAALSALNLAAGYLSSRWFDYGYDRNTGMNDGMAFEQYVTPTEALMGGTVRWVLRSADMDFTLDAQGCLTAVRGTVKAASVYWDESVREVEVQFELAAEDYGTSHVKPFDPADYGVVSAAELFMEEEPQTEEFMTDYAWMDEQFGQPSASLPAYSYSGRDPIEAAVAAYASETLGSHFRLPEGAASIPAPVIVKTEERDDGTAKVYGCFWVWNYTLRGTTLECVSGGAHTGIMTLAKTEKGWEVTAFEQAGDGEMYSRDIQYFSQGDKALEEALYNAADASQVQVKSIRDRFIQDYVTASGLAVRAYQDYGWEPISLAPGSAPKTITALASEINPEHVASVSVYARITGYAADENKLTVELLAPERYDPDEVLSLVPGDAIYTQGQEIAVQTIGEKYGYIVINDGEYEFSEGSIWLYKDSDGSYVIADWDDIRWITLAEVSLPVQDGLLFLDGINPSSGEILDLPTVHSAAEFLEMLKAEAEGEGPGFDVRNVFAVFSADGQLALIQRYYVPWQ